MFYLDNKDCTALELFKSIEETSTDANDKLERYCIVAQRLGDNVDENTMKLKEHDEILDHIGGALDIDQWAITNLFKQNAKLQSDVDKNTKMINRLITLLALGTGIFVGVKCKNKIKKSYNKIVEKFEDLKIKKEN